MAILFALTGCRHNQQDAYAPPPPPDLQSQQYEAQRNSPNAPVMIYSMPDASTRVLASETGIASWYGPSSRNTASGEPYTAMEMTAAHRTLPMNSIIRVTNLATGQSAIVRINDRGPFVQGRIIDLSIAAARATGVYRAGSARVRIDVLRWPPNAASAGHWCVQIGAFQNEEDAIALKHQLLDQYRESTVIEFPGDTGYWVRIKPADLDREDALAVASSVRTEDPSVEAFLLRLD